MLLRLSLYKYLCTRMNESAQMFAMTRCAAMYVYVLEKLRAAGLLNFLCPQMPKCCCFLFAFVGLIVAPSPLL